MEIVKIEILMNYLNKINYNNTIEILSADT